MRLLYSNCLVAFKQMSIPAAHVLALILRFFYAAAAQVRIDRLCDPAWEDSQEASCLPSQHVLRRQLQAHAIRWTVVYFGVGVNM